MPPPRLVLTLAGTLTLLAGCAANRPSPQVRAVAPSSRPAGPAFLELDEIEPRPVLTTTRPATGPAARPPVEALLLYAQAREATLADHPAEAVALLERAAALDPDSYELQYALGKAYRGGKDYDPRAVAAMERAVALEPDHLDAQLDLGRLYLAHGDGPPALERLRLARLTADYKANDPRAFEADLFLANALQALGYDRAAVGQFEGVLRRLADRGPPWGNNPELAAQVTGQIHQELGDLYLRQGQPERALAAYRKAGGEGDDFELQSRLVRTLLVLGRTREAGAAAARAVSQSRASADSVALLRDVYRAVGREAETAAELAKLHAEKSADRAILFALADVLRTDGRAGEADRLLAAAQDQFPADAEIVCRRVALPEAAGDLTGAARLLIEAAARRPNLAGELDEPWARLLRPANRDRLDLDALRALPVRPGAGAARAMAVWAAAAHWPRRAAAKAALAEALQQRPPYPPAFRQRLQDVWDEEGGGTDTKARQSGALAAAAAEAGDAALAVELRGRALLFAGDARGAAAALAEAIGQSAGARAATRPATGPAAHPESAGDDGVAPELHLAFATAVLDSGDAPAFERLAWKVINDHPTFGSAYLALHDYYLARRAASSADRVATAWRRADPNGRGPRLLQTQDALRAGHFDAADGLVGGLLDDFGDDPSVLVAAEALYARTGRADGWVARLEDAVAKSPRGFHAAERLASAYLAARRPADAARALDAARAAAAREPDVLYDLAGLYAKAGQKDVSEDVLGQVLALDPTHPSAGNDLGYAWAEQGKNLDQAEALTRAAVAAEPDNPSLLDSLGWVLYKRGRFAEARDVFGRAVRASADAPDPVLLDHLGDALYRLNDPAAAGRSWEQSHSRLAALGPAATERDDLKPLKLQLQQKQRQLQANQPVAVAAVAEPPPATKPAGGR